MAKCAVAHLKFTVRSAKTVPKQKAPPNWRGFFHSAYSESPRYCCYCFGERLTSLSTSAELPEMAGSAGLAAFSFSVSFL